MPSPPRTANTPLPSVVVVAATRPFVSTETAAPDTGRIDSSNTCPTRIPPGAKPMSRIAILGGVFAPAASCMLPELVGPMRAFDLLVSGPRNTG